MDWLAGSRLHLVDVVATRAVSFLPLFALGFGPLRWVVATPEFHQCHHSASPVDKNFAVHLPVIDRTLGTAWLPGGWPERYGIAGDPVPDGWWCQLLWPLRRRGRRARRRAGVSP